MRLLFATPHRYLPQSVGGMERSTHELCLSLQERGHAVAVLAALNSGGRVGLVNRLRRKLFPARQFPADRIMGYPVFRGWAAQDGVGEVIRMFAPDAVITQSWDAGLYQCFLDCGIPTAHYFRYVSRPGMEFPVTADGRPGFLANSGFNARYHERHFGLRCEVLPPLVIQDRYRTAVRPQHVLFVGTQHAKGIDIALALAERRPDIPFRFIETWSIEPAATDGYRARAACLKNVAWRQPASDMRRVYATCRLVLMPSRWEETWGRMATEAHVSGIPVLASDRGGLPESVGSGGLCLDPDADIEIWHDALARLWDDRAYYDRMSAAAAPSSRPRWPGASKPFWTG